MSELIDGMLALSKAGNDVVSVRSIDLSSMAHEIVAELRRLEPERNVEVFIADGIEATGDRTLLSQAMTNLLGNAWKYTSRVSAARITFDTFINDRRLVYRIADNGAGFDQNYADKLFRPFERLHAASDFPGTGIGLATVKQIIVRHGGRIWAEGMPNGGAVFYFTLTDTSQNV